MNRLPHTPPHRWLITGGCGFLGTSLCAALLAEGGHAIRVYDNLSVGRRDDLGAVCPFREVDGAAPGPLDDGVELVIGDLADAALLARAASGADVIVHFAANTGIPLSLEDPRSDCTANVLGTLGALEAARAAGVPRFIFASSGAATGSAEPPIHEAVLPRPASPYGAGKLAGEAYCAAYHGAFGIETVALRFGNVYGPRSGHKGSVVAHWIRRALAGEPLELHGDGRQTRDFIHVDDLVCAVRAAASAPGIGGEVFQIASAREVSLAELLDALSVALTDAGVALPPVRPAPARAGDVRRNVFDTAKARARLGWRAEVPLPEGLARTVAWFLDGNG